MRVSTATLVIIAVACCFFAEDADAVSHGLYAGFAEPIVDFSLSEDMLSFASAEDPILLNVSTRDDVVYRYGHASYNGGSWQRFELSGGLFGGDWLSGDALSEISLAPQDVGLSLEEPFSDKNFIVVYSCTRSPGSWDCHDGWQIVQFNASLGIGPYCGDGTCGDEESRGTCPADCPEEECVPYDGLCSDGCGSLSDHDCFAEEHSGWPIFTQKDGSDYTNMVYIDPEWNGCESGTISCPYNSWEDVTWQSDTAYVQKRGTSQTITSELEIPQLSDIYIGAYGTGTRPVLSRGAAGSLFNVHSMRTLFSDIHLQNPGSSLDYGGMVIYLRGDAGGSVVYNCTISNAGYDGIFSWAHGLKILYTEVYDIYVDAIWVGNSENVEIAHNYIHDANLMWFDYGPDTSKAGGDAIQFMDGVGVGVDRWWIHNNVIDRSNSGNKFCFHASGTEQDFGIFERNTLSGPRTDGHGGASVYIPSLWDDENSERVLPKNIVVRDNTINGPSPTGVWTEAADLLVEGNTFNGVNDAITNVWGGDLRIIGNDFSNILGGCFKGGYEEESGNTGDCP